MPEKFTARQERFIQEYLIDLNATHAAIRAGYSKKTADVQGSTLLRNPKVKAEIARKQAKVAERAEINLDYVISTIVDTIERCKQAKPVTYKNGEPVMVETPDGDVVPAYAFDSNAILRGSELLGKHLGMFTSEPTQTEPVAVNITIERRDAVKDVRVTKSK